MNGDYSLRVRGVRKSFQGNEVVKGADIEIRKGEFFALLGPSGCGKTTLLRMVAGLEVPDQGTVMIGGRDMTHVPAHERPVNMVFQQYALFPHLDVFENAAFGLRVRRTPGPEIKSRVEEALASVRLAGFERRMPAKLSGGQQQRVALARALVNRPELLLLDEPMAALDEKLREDMREELKSLQHRLGVSFLYVTHDQEEALELADRVAVMQSGRIVQIGTPQEVYEAPADAFVADFVGVTNLLAGRVSGTEELLVDAGESRRIWLEVEGVGRLESAADRSWASGAQVAVSLRPERIHVSSSPADGLANRIQGIVERRVFLGSDIHYHVRLAQGALLRAHDTFSPLDPPHDAGAPVWVGWRCEDARVLPG
ncbi:MAG: ABC transporter ATP-binding protein [Elusimicrobiota bacterium]|jgi:spermidine/putrescine ABC transporter ATP-binding subunit